MTDSKMPERSALAISIEAMCAEWYASQHKSHLPAEVIQKRIDRFTHPAPVADAELVSRGDVIATIKKFMHGDGNLDLPRWEVDELMAEITALRARTAQPVGVRVRELEWTGEKDKSYRQANCIFGQYQVSWLVEFECWQLSRPHVAGAKWSANFTRHKSRDEAMQAAQADYEQRILSALLPDGGATCRKCGGEMRPGIAIGQTYVGGLPDFPGDDAAITMSAGGPGELIGAMKCSACGWSVTEGGA